MTVIQGNFAAKNIEQSVQNPPIICSMCGQPKANGVPIVSNQSFHICGNCINYSYNMIKDDAPMKLEGDFRKKTPSKIVEFVSQYVIGQDSAKETIALAIYNHYKRMSNPTFNDVELQKSNILMVGPSGTGKTYLVQSIARFLDIPFTIADATTLTEAGFVGEDVESILQKLIQAANGDVKKAEHGIIFLDEVDKIAKKSSGASTSKDPSGEGTQQALLKILEGTQSRVLKNGSRKTANDAMDVIDTTNILFICGGAFVGLDDITQKNHGASNRGIGFGATVEKDKKETKFSPEPEDLYEYGMIPELVGRLPVICTLDELDVSALSKILVEPKNSVVKQFQSLVEMDGARLEFTSEAIDKIAELAAERKTGARGLRSIVESVLNKHMFTLPDQDDVEKLVVSLNSDTLEVKTITKE